MAAGHRRAAGAVAGLVLLTGACAGAPDAADAQPPAATSDAPDGAATSPPASAPASPDVEPVAGTRRPSAHWVNSDGLLTPRAPEVGSTDVVLAPADAVGDWLDGHLDDLQRGGPGTLEAVAPSGLLAAAGADDLAAITRDLASPADPVAAASYRFDVSFDAAVEWVQATVEVTGRSGTTRAATLVFVPTDDGLELVLFGPAAPASPEVGG